MPEHPNFLPAHSPARASADELRTLVERLVGTLGVKKIRFTGGEPTLDPELVNHVHHASSLVRIVGLTTNGVRLAPLLPALHDAGLTKLNISLDAANREDFLAVTRRDDFEKVLSAIRLARGHFSPLKVNCVATRTTDVAALTRLAMQEAFHVRFIELMEVGEAAHTWNRTFVSAATLRDQLRDAGIEIEEARHLDEPTSRVWTVAGHDPAEVSVGFITTVSEPFCEGCDRIRITQEGRLHSCLFDERGTELLTHLRSGHVKELTRAIHEGAQKKRRPLLFRRKATMASIGG